MKKILVIGAGGQLGSVLTDKLQNRYGSRNVFASDVRPLAGYGEYFIRLDATDFESLKSVVTKFGITEIYHLAAILSASGEKFPLDTWDINMKTFFNVLEVSRLHGVSKVFYPSSIAVFGQNAPRVDTPQSAPLCPTTVYGISKVAGENWASYYHRKYGLDIRSLRYPGIIGYQSTPGGGTTDYAVHIFHKAVQNKPYECFLKPSTMLPMIYMDDAIRATIELMEAPAASVTVRTSYNLAGMSFSPSQLAASIKGYYPGFEISYSPDFRQEIADSWPTSIDDLSARKGWGWKPAYNLEAMTEAMTKQLKLKYQNQYSVV